MANPYSARVWWYTRVVQRSRLVCSSQLPQRAHRRDEAPRAGRSDAPDCYYLAAVTGILASTLRILPAVRTVTLKRHEPARTAVT
jgi:hypothetical protein